MTTDSDNWLEDQRRLLDQQGLQAEQADKIIAAFPGHKAMALDDIMCQIWSIGLALGTRCQFDLAVGAWIIAMALRERIEDEEGNG